MVYYSHARANRACIVHLAPYHIGCPEPKGEKMRRNLCDYEAAANKPAGARTPEEVRMVQEAYKYNMQSVKNLDIKVNGRPSFRF